MMDAFKDRLSERARDTTRPALAHQSRGRELTSDEAALAKALMDIYGQKIHDFSAVARELQVRGVKAPRSGRNDWTVDLLAEELDATNVLLDEAYEANGYGA